MENRPIASFLLCSFLLAVAPASYGQAPAPTGDPKALFSEASKAFETKDYATAAAKMEQLLPHLANPAVNPETRELVMFNLGLAHLLNSKFPEAEKRFTDCLAAFPNGEYASRCALGIGQAALAQAGTDKPDKAKQDRAIAALKRAAADPKYRAEAGLMLGQVYSDTGREKEALAVFRSLMGSDIRTPQQTAASVEAVGLLANAGKLDTLVAYMDRLINQAGVRDAITWFTNQIIVKGDELAAAGKYDAALAIFRSIPPRSQILEIQALNIAEKKTELGLLKTNLDNLEKLQGPELDRAQPRILAIKELIGSYEGLIKQVEEATKAIEELKDLDAMLLMRRGRCFYYLKRKEEALLSFRTMREKYPETKDAGSAAFAEIVILHELKNVSAIQPLGEEYLRKYPDASNAEQVAQLVGQLLAQSNDWAKVLSFYQDLEKKYPNSSSIDSFVFYQGVAMFQNGDFKDSAALFEKFIKTYPQSQMHEQAMYRIAMAYFLTNSYKKTLEWCRNYLTTYPDGKFAGDVLYRLAFIDSQDREKDQSEKIVKNLAEYLAKHPEDPGRGPMLTLLGDTYKKLKSNNEAVLKENEAKALDCYKKAIWSGSSDDIVQYAMEQATAIMQANADWQGIVDVYQRFMSENPNHQGYLPAAIQVARGMQRMGKAEEGAKLLSTELAKTIGDPSREQVESLINEIVNQMVPKRRAPDFDGKALDQKLVDMLNAAVGAKESPTTFARISYARAQMWSKLKDTKQSDSYLKAIADSDLDPNALSPMLLAVCGDILLKDGKLDRAEKMYQRLADRYKESTFSDAGPVGLGEVALARGKAEDALKIFNDALENNPGSSRFREATIGKLKALKALSNFDEAKALAIKIAGDRSFRGPMIGETYIILGDCLREAAKKESAEKGVETIKEAHGYYQRVYTAYQGYPEICAEAYYKAWEALKSIGSDVAAKTLQDLKDHPKLKDTKYWLKAQDAN